MGFNQQQWLYDGNIAGVITNLINDCMAYGHQSHKPGSRSEKIERISVQKRRTIPLISATQVLTVAHPHDWLNRHDLYSSISENGLVAQKKGPIWRQITKQNSSSYSDGFSQCKTWYIMCSYYVICVPHHCVKKHGDYPIRT
jgi:hypothetical protein